GAARQQAGDAGGDGTLDHDATVQAGCRWGHQSLPVIGIEARRPWRRSWHTRSPPPIAKPAACDKRAAILRRAARSCPTFPVRDAAPTAKWGSKTASGSTDAIMV